MKILSRLFFLTASLVVAFAADPLTEAFQRGLLAEESQRDLKAAAAAYDEVLRQADAQRELIATALFRRAEVRRRLGRTNEAEADYRRLLRQFAEQTNLMELARVRLPQNAGKPAMEDIVHGVPPGTVADQLIGEEINLALKQVAELQQQVAQGKASQAELLQAQRDVLSLKRQAARLRQPDVVDVIPGPEVEVAREADDESREIERLRRMLANSPDLINAPKGDPLETPLQTAARLDQARVVEFLLAQKADLNIPAGGRTPLHVAAKAGHKRMVELLLKAGAKVDAQASDGQTPLHMAIAAGHRQVVQALVTAGANLSLRTQRGPSFAQLPDGNNVSEVTPMGLAIALGNVPLMELLAGAGANFNEPVATLTSVSRTALTLALKARSFLLAARLLDLGANPATEGDGMPMILAVSVSAPPDLLDRLLKGGAPLTAKLEQGETLLHLAVRSDHEEGASWLLKHGLSPDAQNADGESALLVAVNSMAQQRGRAWSPTQKPSAALAITELLLAAKANPNLASRRGYSPLRMAVESGQPEMVKRLLQAGGDPNQSHPVLGPLLNAAIVGARPAPGVIVPRSVPSVGGAGNGSEESGMKREVAAALLAAGADPNAEHQGYRLLGYAINLGPEWVQLFLHHRADPNRRPSGGGETPLEAIQRYRSYGRPAELTLESLAESERLLRAAGARDDVPDFSTIKVARKSANYVQAVFRSGATNDPNRFTLLELLAAHYGAMTAPLAFRDADPAAGGGGLDGVGIATASRPALVRPGYSQREAGLGFTDWRRVVIYRAAKQVLERQEVPVDVEALVAAGDCSRDVALEWGDVVELPERDHPVGAAFEGAPAGMGKLWQTCLARTVTITIKGEAKPLKLAVGAGTTVSPPAINPFSLLGALRQPGLLRTSSDLRQVRVERPIAPQPLRWRLDCSDSGAAATFWLRDGDMIFVPDLPAGGE